VFDGLVSDLVVAGDAVGVDGQQHAGAVPGAGGDLGGRRAGGPPQRQRGVPQVVGPAGRRRGGQVRAQRRGAGGVPGAAVEAFVQIRQPDPG
jgi:hypothetical protein